MEKKPFYTIDNCNSRGLDRIPRFGLVLNKTNGSILNLSTKSGITSTTKLKDGSLFLAFQPQDSNLNCLDYNIATSQGVIFIQKPDGTLYGKGWNVDGEMGVAGGKTDWFKITGFDGYLLKNHGVYNTFLVKADGTVWAAGWNDPGCLGVGDANTVAGFRQVVGITNPLKIAGSNEFAILEGSDGYLYGSGVKGWSGVGKGYTATFIKSTLYNGGTPLKTLQTGLSGGLCQLSTGEVYVCGDNNLYEFGQATPTGSNTWLHATWLDNAKLIAYGNGNLFIVKQDNTVWRSGGNWYGNLGTGNTTPLTTLTQLTGFDNPNKIVVDQFQDGGGSFTVIEKSDGTVWACGKYGTANLGTTFIQLTGVTSPKSILVKNGTIYILTQNDELYGLGNNEYKQIINTGTRYYNTLQLIPKPERVIDKQPLYVFKNDKEVGLDKVPPGSLVGFLCDGAIFRLEDKTGIINTTLPKDVKGTKLKEYVLATGRVERSCEIGPDNLVRGIWNMFVYPCSYWDHWFTELDGSNINTSPSYPGRYRLFGTNEYSLATDVYHVMFFNPSGTLFEIIPMVKDIEMVWQRFETHMNLQTSITTVDPNTYYSNISKYW